MAQIFISFSSVDVQPATQVKRHLEAEGVSVFMSPFIEAGRNWSQEILQELRSCDCVVFLASRDACKSSYVLNETGGAILTGKKLIPVVWDMDPSDLPGWTNEYQALDLRAKDVPTICNEIGAIAKKNSGEQRTCFYFRCGSDRWFISIYCYF